MIVASFASAVVGAETERVWSVVRDFATVGEWHPMVSACCPGAAGRADGVGAERVVALGPGPAMTERVLECNPGEHVLVYGLVDSPLPITGYRAVVRLVPVTHTGATFVQWSSTFAFVGAQVPEIRTLAQDVLDAGVAGLVAHFQRA